MLVLQHDQQVLRSQSRVSGAPVRQRVHKSQHYLRRSYAYRHKKPNTANALAQEPKANAHSSHATQILFLFRHEYAHHMPDTGNLKNPPAVYAQQIPGAHQAKLPSHVQYRTPAHTHTVTASLTPSETKNSRRSKTHIKISMQQTQNLQTADSTTHAGVCFFA